MILYIDKLKILHQKLLELISEFSKLYFRIQEEYTENCCFSINYQEEKARKQSHLQLHQKE